MSRKIRISERDRSLIREELKKNHPYEACGVLVGLNEDDLVKVERAVPVKNSKRTEKSFELDPAEFYRVWNESQEQGLDIVGIYHTHPFSKADPSSWDVETMQMVPNVWVIAGIDGISAYQWVDGNVEKVGIV